MKLGTPALVLGMIVMLERIDTKVRAIRDDVQELKAVITRQDTCAARHEEITAGSSASSGRYREGSENRGVLAKDAKGAKNAKERH